VFTRTLLLVLALSLLDAQTALQRQPAETVGRLKAEPEPRRKLSRDPLEFVQDLVSPVAARGARAFSELTGSQMTEDAAPVPNSNFRAVNLDGDPDLEYVFTLLHGGITPSSSVVVVDRGADGWYAVGTFRYWWHWNAEDTERMVEVHAPFLLVRDIEGGSGLSETRVKIFRLWQGRLFKTFEAEEEATSGGAGLDRKLQSRIHFREAGFPLGTGLEVRNDETTSSAETRWRPVRRRSCTGYAWVPRSFSFEASAMATREFCQSR